MHKLKELNIIALHTRKGGVGKTTTADNLAVAISRTTKSKVLVLDMDSQGNSTSAFKRKNELPVIGINEWFDNNISSEKLEKTINESNIEGVLYVGSDEDLEDIPAQIINKISRETILLKNILKMNDYFVNNDIGTIIMDLAPSWTIVTMNAYMAAQSGVLQVIEPSKFSLDTLILNIKKWDQEMKEFGMESNVKGIILNKGKTGKNTKDMYALLKEKMPHLMFDTIIPSSMAIENSVLNNKKWAMDETRLNNYKRPKWMLNNELINEHTKDGNPFVNLVDELIKKEILA